MNNRNQEIQNDVIQDARDYSQTEIYHTEILEQVCVNSRSNGKIITDRTRIEAIDTLLQGSPYQKIYDEGLCTIYSQVHIDELPNQIVLISSHCDVVNSISDCYSEFNRETGLLHGTYDNGICNASSVILMKEEHLPNNIVFAFTGDEETGRCGGALEAASFLQHAGKQPFCVALDVTYEGFNKNRLITVENLVPATDNLTEKTALESIGQILLDMEPSIQTFELVYAGKNHIPDCFPKDYISTQGMYDEACAYSHNGYPTMSLCIPVGVGNMHGMDGVYVKQPVFEGYLLNLYTYAVQLSSNLQHVLLNRNRRTSEHENLIEAYKVAREFLVAEASGIEPPSRQKSNTTFYQEKDDYDVDYDDSIDLYEQALDSISYGLGLEYFLATAGISDEVYESLGIQDKEHLTKGEQKLLKNYLTSIFNYALSGEYDEEEEDYCGLPFQQTESGFHNQYDLDDDYDFGFS